MQYERRGESYITAVNSESGVVPTMPASPSSPPILRNDSLRPSKTPRMPSAMRSTRGRRIWRTSHRRQSPIRQSSAIPLWC